MPRKLRIQYPGAMKVNGNQQHGKCHLFLKRHRQQLLGVHGLATQAGASPELPCQPSQERDRFRLCRVQDWRKAAVVAIFQVVG